jgi:pimeloyl-ACP methyl ester carboxylesterase
MEEKIEHIEVGTGDVSRRIAILRRKGRDPGLVWLGGYRSDMGGTKAQAIDRWCAENGLACCRHDYSGHGRSGGSFSEGTISRWLEESLAVFERCTAGPQILVGSSMGAWIALRMVQELSQTGGGERLAGLLLIAPAPDFTEELMWPEMSQMQRSRLVRDGYLEEQSQYSDEPNIYTRQLFEDGRRNLVMTGPITTGCPVHIVQGMADPDVPWRHALKLTGFISAPQVLMTLVKDGDHRLSRQEDIELLLRLASTMALR